MSETNIYEDGTAEFALLRAIFPFVAFMGIGIVMWHFGDFDSLATGDAQLDAIYHTISTRLAWIALLLLPPLGLLLVFIQPPAVRLAPSWVFITTISGIMAMGLIFWLIA